MTAIFNGKLKYLFLIPVVLLIIFAFQSLLAIGKLNEELLSEKKYSIQAEIDNLANFVDRSVKQGKVWDRNDIVKILGPVISDINRNKNNVFAALYDQNSILLSSNISNSDFRVYDIKGLSAYNTSIINKSSGWIEVPDTKIGSVPMSVYFKWTPSDSSNNEYYLIIAGVNIDSLSINPGKWLTTGMIIHLTVTFVMNTSFVFLLCYLGNIYASRNGTKWRNAW